jgi:SAM-dependent methyltransferase
MGTTKPIEQDANRLARSRREFSLWSQCKSNPSLLMLVKELRSVLAGCQTVLDVGCGNFSPMRFLPGIHLVGVDGYARALEEAQKNGTHDEYVLGDVKRIGELFRNRQFDACVALDVIEHLSKEDGWKLSEAMERLGTRRVVIHTPNGFLPQQSHEGDLQEHLSGWTAQEMRGEGYQVFGMYGPKSLRGEYHHIKYQPRIFWLMVSFVVQFIYSRNHPDSAAAIFCVKKLAE